MGYDLETEPNATYPKNKEQIQDLFFEQIKKLSIKK